MSDTKNWCRGNTSAIQVTSTMHPHIIIVVSTLGNSAAAIDQRLATEVPHLHHAVSIHKRQESTSAEKCFESSGHLQ